MRQTRIALFIITTLLLSLGTVMIYSASAVYASEKYGDMAFFLKKHLLAMAIGLVGAVLVMKADYLHLRRYSRVFLVVGFLLLILVFVPGLGREVGGARRWLRFPPIQPSEFVKIALIFYLADYLARRQEIIETFCSGFLKPVLILGVVSGLVLLQPDLGTAGVMVGIAILMFFVAGIRLMHLLTLLLFLFPLGSIFIFSADYRRQRIMTFLNPWKDPGGSGFQIIQSFIALGSGGLFGVGLGQSRQKLFYLPASHTDFIFAIVGEELGLAGASAVVILFILFVWQGIKIALKAGNLFGQLLAVGLVSLIGMEAVINIGVSTGVLPTKGLPLPFLGYGGSALVTNMVAVGLLLNIGRGQVSPESVVHGS